MQFDHLKRREFMTLLGGVTIVWPLSARAQQPAMPIVGLVSPRSPEDSARLGAGFRKALSETGYIEGQNVMVEYHWVEGQYDRLPALMADRPAANNRSNANEMRGCSTCRHRKPGRTSGEEAPRCIILPRRIGG